ncbi:MAG: futalosine hydrolase [Desulfuromonadales bacterium]|nr:futalosine hydrolase [Desulfuromonadales bacterium]
MKPILILAAVPQETALLKQALGDTARLKSDSFDYTEGNFGSQPVVICAGGIGKINAASVATALIERYHPRLVINTGCAGAYLASGLSIGDLAVASDEILGDEGVLMSDDWHDLKFMGIPSLILGSRMYHNAIPLSRHAAEKAMQLADYVGIRMVRGCFITVSTCSGCRQRGEELVQRFQGVCENMEGAAIAQVGLRYGIDCLEIRGISNLVDERDMKTWDIPRAVDAAQRFVLKYIEELERPVPKRGLNRPIPD